jgi:hypothetical protein
VRAAALRSLRAQEGAAHSTLLSLTRHTLWVSGRQQVMTQRVLTAAERGIQHRGPKVAHVGQRERLKLGLLRVGYRGQNLSTSQKSASRPKEASASLQMDDGSSRGCRWKSSQDLPSA